MRRDAVHLDVLRRLPDVQLPALFHVAQSVRRVGQVLDQNAFQLEVLVTGLRRTLGQILVEENFGVVDQNAFQLEILVQQDDAAAPAVDKHQTPAAVEAHVREVVQRVDAVEFLQDNAGEVELVQLENVGAVTPSPVADHDRLVRGFHGVWWWWWK